VTPIGSIGVFLFLHSQDGPEGVSRKRPPAIHSISPPDNFTRSRRGMLRFQEPSRIKFSPLSTAPQSGGLPPTIRSGRGFLGVIGTPYKGNRYKASWSSATANTMRRVLRVGGNHASHILPESGQHYTSIRLVFVYFKPLPRAILNPPFTDGFIERRLCPNLVQRKPVSISLWYITVQTLRPDFSSLSASFAKHMVNRCDSS